MTLTGDPASVSQAGATLRRLAEQLRRYQRQLQASLPADAPRDGAALARARRRADQLATAVARTVTELDRVGSALQDHSHDLSEAVAIGRDVTERAAGAGLVADGGAVTPRWGVTGVADRASAAEQGQARADLQGELDRAATILSRRRLRLVQALRESTSTLAGEADALRR